MLFRSVQAAADAAYAEYESHMAKIRVKGSEIIDEARRQGKRIIVLAGRPYHVDPEVNHGIDRLITGGRLSRRLPAHHGRQQQLIFLQPQGAVPSGVGLIFSNIRQPLSLQSHASCGTISPIFQQEAIVWNSM